MILLWSVVVVVLLSVVVVVIVFVRDVIGWVVVVDNVEFVGLIIVIIILVDVVVVVVFCGFGQVYDFIRLQMMMVVSWCIFELVMVVVMIWKF